MFSGVHKLAELRNLAVVTTFVLCAGYLPPPNDLHGSGVRLHEIRTNVIGDLYLPPTSGRVPGLILLGGSDGQPMKERSTLLASNGYAVLNLFYFGHGPLPKQFAEVPLEYLTNAVSWLQAHERVDPTRVGLIGYSRGAEAALLIATFRSDVKAVVAVAPSSVIWPGPGASGYFHSAWSLNGKELPYVPIKFSKGFGTFLKEVRRETQIEHRPLFEDGLKNKQAVELATIPVEKIRGALLLISGKDDRVWPSAPMAEMIVGRLRDRQHTFTFQHVCYENAGHSFGLPGVTPSDNRKASFKMGGTAAGNAEAAVRSWQTTLEFLQLELGPPK